MQQIFLTTGLTTPLKGSTWTRVSLTIDWRWPDSKRKKKLPVVSVSRPTIDCVMTPPQGVANVTSRTRTHKVHCPRCVSTGIRCIEQPPLMKILSNSCSTSSQTIHRTQCSKWVSINTKVLLSGQSQLKRIIRMEDQTAIHEHKGSLVGASQFIYDHSICILRDSLTYFDQAWLTLKQGLTCQSISPTSINSND